jgi:hypothetical protein
MSLIASMRGCWLPLWLGAAALLAAAATGHGQTFACAEDTAGQLSEQAGVRCRCVHVPEGAITGRAAGYAWDCGILRDRRNQLVPATPEVYPVPPIDAVVVDPTRTPDLGSIRP